MTKNSVQRAERTIKKNQSFLGLCSIRVLKNERQAVSQGVRRFGKRNLFIDM